MKTNISNGPASDGILLILGGTGKTGRRIAEFARRIAESGAWDAVAAA